jgi:hypothetical protein
MTKGELETKKGSEIPACWQAKLRVLAQNDTKGIKFIYWP